MDFYYQLVNDQIFRNYSQLNHQIQKPFFPLKYVISSGIFCLSTNVLTKIPPWEGLAFIHTVFLIDQFLLGPIMSPFVEPHRQITLVLFSAKCVRVNTSLLTTKFIFAIFQREITMRQAYTLAFFFLTSFYLSRLLIRHLNRIITSDGTLSINHHLSL